VYSQHAAAPRERVLTLLLLLLLAACVTRLWLMPLPSSFWVDEMATVFVVQHGPNHPSLAVAPQVPDSIYYQLPRAAQSLIAIIREHRKASESPVAIGA